MSTQAPAILTKEFCAKNGLSFHPQSEEEAAFIQEQFFAMGFRWNWDSESTDVKQLPELAEGTLYLNYLTGRGMAWDRGRREYGILCTADQFGVPVPGRFEPETRRVKEIIASDSFQDKTWLFYPASEEDARYIQKKLFALGVVWSGENGETTVYTPLKCVMAGMAVVEGKIYLDPLDEDIRTGVICRAEQLGDDYPRQNLTPEQIARQAMFNELSARIKQQGAQIRELQDEIIPKPLQKVAFPQRRSQG